MPVVLLLTALLILGGVVVVAIGRGGELAVFRADVPPLRQGLVTAADVASFRPPVALFGYSPQVTHDALRGIARTVADRDAELALLRGQVAALRSQLGPAGGSAAGGGGGSAVGGSAPGAPWADARAAGAAGAGAEHADERDSTWPGAGREFG